MAFISQCTASHHLHHIPSSYNIFNHITVSCQLHLQLSRSPYAYRLLPIGVCMGEHNDPTPVRHDNNYKRTQMGQREINWLSIPSCKRVPCRILLQPCQYHPLHHSFCAASPQLQYSFSTASAPLQYSFGTASFQVQRNFVAASPQLPYRFSPASTPLQFGRTSSGIHWHLSAARLNPSYSTTLYTCSGDTLSA